MAPNPSFLFLQNSKCIKAFGDFYLTPPHTFPIKREAEEEQSENKGQERKEPLCQMHFPLTPLRMLKVSILFVLIRQSIFQLCPLAVQKLLK